jgi:hypothetical protein
LRTFGAEVQRKFNMWFIEHAQIYGQNKIEGVIPHLVDGWLSILHYVDDLILFMEHDLEMSRNLNYFYELSSNFLDSK